MTWDSHVYTCTPIYEDVCARARAHTHTHTHGHQPRPLATISQTWLLFPSPQATLETSVSPCLFHCSSTHSHFFLSEHLTEAKDNNNNITVMMPFSEKTGTAEDNKRCGSTMQQQLAAGPPLSITTFEVAFPGRPEGQGRPGPRGRGSQGRRGGGVGVVVKGGAGHVVLRSPEVRSPG